MGNIRISNKVESTTVLGPGNRAVIWTYGCCFDCPGCIAPNYKNGEYTKIDVKELADWFLSLDKDQLTISGGEPMLQADALSEMLELIKRERDVGVIVYTGFTYENLLQKDSKGITNFLNNIDILIDGPYVEDLNHNERSRGSSNQRIIQLTNRYIDDCEYYQQEGREIEILVTGNRTIMVGVPAKNQARIWESIKDLAE